MCSVPVAVEEEADVSEDVAQFKAFPDVPPGLMFAIACEKDQQAHARIQEMIEAIIAAAPRRQQLGQKVISGLMRAQCICANARERE